MESTGNIPHQSILIFKANIMERLPDGRVTGNSIEKHQKIFTIKGNSKEEVVTNTKNFMKEVDELWSKKYAPNLVNKI